MVVSLDVGFLDSSVPLPLLCNLLASSSRSVKRVVGSDDMKGLLNSKVLGLVMSNIFFFSRLPTKNCDGYFYQRNRKPIFHLHIQEDFNEKDW